MLFCTFAAFWEIHLFSSIKEPFLWFSSSCCYAKKDMSKIPSQSICQLGDEKVHTFHERRTCFSDSLSWEVINRLPRRKRDGSSSCANRITYSALMPWLLKAFITDVTRCSLEKTWANKSLPGSEVSTLSKLLGDCCQ